MMIIIKKYKIYYALYSILIYTLIAIATISYLGDSSFFGINNENTLMIINGIFGWIVLIIHVITWKKISDTIINLSLMFFIFYVVFNFGQSLLYVFVQGTTSYRNLFLFASNNEIIKAQLFTLLGMITFSLGTIIAYSNSPKLHENASETTSDVEIMLKAIGFVGGCLLLISLPSFAYNVASTLKDVISGGYVAIYDYGTGEISRASFSGKLSSLLSSYFLPSIICLFVAKNKNNYLRYSLNVLFITDTLYLFYVGVRTSAICVIIVFLILHHRLVKPIKRKQIGLFIIVGYFFLGFVNVVGELRSEAGRSVLDYFIQMGESSPNSINPMVMLVTELGWSMFPLIAVMKLIPGSYNYAYGTTYLWAFTSIIPNIGLWDIHPAALYSDGPNWLMKVLNMPYGPGFSISAEAFRNFGWMGSGFLIFLGILFVKIYKYDNVFSAKHKPNIFAIMLIVFSTTLVTVRGDIMGFIRPTAFVAIPIYLLINLKYNSMLKAKN